MAVSHKDKLKIVALMRREVSTSPHTSKEPAWERVFDLMGDDEFALPPQAEEVGTYDDILGDELMSKVVDLSDDLTLWEIVQLGKLGVLDEE
jgi:hypothetical protein